MKGSRKKKSLAIILAVMMLISLMPMVAMAAFDDSPPWAEEAINRWHAAGVVRGDEGGFRPYDPITRGEMATVLNNLMDYQTVATNVFSDLNAGDWFTGAILRANVAGVMLGFGDNTVRPDHNITREGAVTMLSRAFLLPTNDAVGQFTDAAQINDWARPHVGGMAAAGFVQGYNNQFRPQDPISRAEVAVMLNNLIYALHLQAGVAPEVTTAAVSLVNTSGVIHNNANITGTLFLSQGLRAGTFALNNSTVNRMIVQGGGTININNSTVTAFIAYHLYGDVRVYLDGSTLTNVDVSMERNHRVIFIGPGNITNLTYYYYNPPQIGANVTVLNRTVIGGPGNGGPGGPGGGGGAMPAPPAIADNTADFELNTAADLEFTVALGTGAQAATGITSVTGGTPAITAADWNLTGTTLTINAAWLNEQATGPLTLTVEFNNTAATTVTLEITITEAMASQAQIDAVNDLLDFVDNFDTAAGDVYDDIIPLMAELGIAVAAGTVAEDAFNAIDAAMADATSALAIADAAFLAAYPNVTLAQFNAIVDALQTIVDGVTPAPQDLVDAIDEVLAAALVDASTLLAALQDVDLDLDVDVDPANAARYYALIAADLATVGTDLYAAAEAWGLDQMVLQANAMQAALEAIVEEANEVADVYDAIDALETFVNAGPPATGIEALLEELNLNDVDAALYEEYFDAIFDALNDPTSDLAIALDDLATAGDAARRADVAAVVEALQEIIDEVNAAALLVSAGTFTVLDAAPTAGVSGDPDQIFSDGTTITYRLDGVLGTALVADNAFLGAMLGVIPADAELTIEAGGVLTTVTVDVDDDVTLGDLPTLVADLTIYANIGTNDFIVGNIDLAAYNLTIGGNVDGSVTVGTVTGTGIVTVEVLATGLTINASGDIEINIEALGDTDEVTLVLDTGVVATVVVNGLVDALVDLELEIGNLEDVDVTTDTPLTYTINLDDSADGIVQVDADLGASVITLEAIAARAMLTITVAA